MKLLGLLFVVVGSFSICFAADNPGGGLPQQASINPILQIGSVAHEQNVAPLFNGWSNDDSRATAVENDRQGKPVTCYKIRSYHIARENRDSDVTRLDGYSTCQFATHFAVKKANAVDMNSH